MPALQPSAAPTPWWVQHNATGNEYMQIGSGMSFDGCQQLCTAIGGGLASIGSAGENEFLSASGLRGWIGLYNHRACTRKWTSGEDADYLRVIELVVVPEFPANCHLFDCDARSASCSWDVTYCDERHSCVCERGLTTSESYAEWEDVQLHRSFKLSVAFGVGVFVFGLAMVVCLMTIATRHPIQTLRRKENLRCVAARWWPSDRTMNRARPLPFLPPPPPLPSRIFCHFVLATMLWTGGTLSLMLYFGKPPKACDEFSRKIGTTFMILGLVNLLRSIAWNKIIARRLEAWRTARAERREEELARARDEQRSVELAAMPGEMTVFVTLLDGSKVALGVCGSDTVETLKRKVHAKEGLDHRHQRMLLDKRELTEGTVESNGIAPDATVHLLMAAEAGFAPEHENRRSREAS